MNSKRLLILCTLWLTTISLFAADYIFESYHVDVEVSASNVYTIQEDIVANFTVPRHGIYREIPVQFGKKRVELTNLKSSDPLIQDTVSRQYITFRLGSPNSTVVGRKAYSISYIYDIGRDDNEGYDEVYFNLVGPGWQSIIKDFSFRVTLPERVDPSRIWLTGGSYGSTVQRGSFALSADGKTLSGSAQDLLPGEALTLRIEMDEGTFVGTTHYRDYTLPASLLALLFSLAACLYATYLFKRYGQEELFVPVVRFEPPVGFSPLEVGYIADGRVDNKDLTSLLFYWADQGCLTIEEKSKKEVIFTRLKDPLTDKVHELNLFHSFFAAGDGQKVTLKDLEKEEFSQAMQRARSETLAYFKKERKLNDSVAERKRIQVFLLSIASLTALAIASSISYIDETTVVLFVLGVFSMLFSSLFTRRLTSNWEMRSRTSQIVKSIAFILGSFLVALVAIVVEFVLVENSLFLSCVMGIALALVPAYLGFLAVVTAKRSPYAHTMLEQTIGYRDFISKVEVDKLKMLIDDDPELFYHVLGYAIVLGLENKWAKKFSTIAMNPPSWYQGQNLAFNALFYSSLSRRIHTNVMEHSMYAQARRGPSSGVRSSFGGSGFSGGGFGGGGGGAW